MPKRDIEQDDRFDENSLSSLDEDEDEYEIDYDEDEDDENYDEKREVMNKATSKFNLDGKGKVIAIVLGLGLIVAFILLNPFGGEGGEESEGEGGFSFSSILAKLNIGGGSDSLDDLMTNEEEFSMESLMTTLSEDFPEYEQILNEETGELTLTGLNADGLEHQMIYDAQGMMLDELLDGVSLFGEEIIGEVDENGNPIEQPSDTGIVENEDGTLTHPDGTITSTDGTVIQKGTAPVDKANPNTYNTVTINQQDYEKTWLSKKEQPINLTFDEYEKPMKDTTVKRLIVQYEKLPPKGNLLQLFVKVIDTGETFSMHVSAEEYFSLEDTGSTVVEAEITTMHGVVSYDSLELIQW